MHNEQMRNYVKFKIIDRTENYVYLVCLFISIAGTLAFIMPYKNVLILLVLLVFIQCRPGNHYLVIENNRIRTVDQTKRFIKVKADEIDLDRQSISAIQLIKRINRYFINIEFKPSEHSLEYFKKTYPDFVFRFLQKKVGNKILHKKYEIAFADFERLIRVLSDNAYIFVLEE